MSNPKHTPTPWEQFQHEPYRIYGEDGWVVAEAALVETLGIELADRAQANAERIVHCVNHFDEMLATLRDAEDLLLHGSNNFAFKKWEPVYAAIQRAIAKAEGRKV